MRFSGYIFDVEGTLVDSVPQNLLSLTDAGCFAVTKDLNELLTYLESGPPRPAVIKGGIIVSGCGTSLFVRTGT